ncbi:hypothetical protein [Sediminicola sp. 1XM1-17]|uniref:hypothetical protein n=1 Tax=Sediminicola sp. 1XM1-17 TaxID=3127702 RepID=UPI0030783E78
MMGKQIYIGKNPAHFTDHKVGGEYVEIENETYYRISNNDAMRPFFMSIVSDSNHWMFLASNGGITAGRKDSDMALFPYYTDDKITESADVTGSKTMVQAHLSDKTVLWEPFSENQKGVYNTRRNLYKNKIGNKIIFEESNLDLGLTFRYHWNSSNDYGFVRKSALINDTNDEVQVTLLDGIQNILPYGISAALQNNRSNLVDAYKKNELEAEIGLGIFALSAIIVDKSEPSEALKATIAWSLGLEHCSYLISSRQLDSFRKGLPLSQEVDVKAEKSAYFVHSDLTLGAKKSKNWIIVANVNQGPSDVAHISNLLRTEKDLQQKIQADIDLGTKNLKELTASADGFQASADELRTTRHFANVMFNIMRGGIFDHNYQIEAQDFKTYLKKANQEVFKIHSDMLKQLPEVFSLSHLKSLVQEHKDPDFKRLCMEYMPLKFSRRHGDPSRPWNKFSINTRSEEDGSKVLDYEGNWRDIFQNWEALAHSYPEFMESMIFKFLNASTFDGYNPYRVTKGGFDWEVIEPEDPFSFIGYWGDHQIVYLLKFLEFIEDYYPNTLASYFNEDVFVYANVPYKIKGYSDILNNPKDTIVFDDKLDHILHGRKKELGADGLLLLDQSKAIYRVNFIEKLLATALAKCSNFIPEGGIWLNTQRPEWNDANNALVGNGVSMVTLFYLRRFLKFFKGLTEDTNINDVAISEEVIELFHEIFTTLEGSKHVLKGKISNADRKTIVDGLGMAGGAFRSRIYQEGFTGTKKSLTKSELTSFFDVMIAYLDHSIQANKRADNLYHSYNLMSVENDNEISVSYLTEMLEGQVAVLASDCISSEQALQVLDALKESRLYRKDQSSYILYPNKELSRFVAKNNIPAERIKKSELALQLMKDGNTKVIERDINGAYHFNGSFNNANSLKDALEKLPEQYQELVAKDRKLLLDIFEEIFDHKSFTGRSGTFFGYEGLGSIYWHMVSKLLLAVQECCLNAIEDNAGSEVVNGLKKHYYEISEGIGVHKSPEHYGAFPTDPYSHTPASKGAQQPGMTGQVKEDILSRFGELGIRVESGKLSFNPKLLKKEEFFKEEATMDYFDVEKNEKKLQLPKNSFAFTYCQIPVVYELGGKPGLEILYKDGTSDNFGEPLLDEPTSRQIFERKDVIAQIRVALDKL